MSSRWLLVVALTVHLAAQGPTPFAIKIVDATTGRGVPLVELETTHHLLFVTDSNGIAAIDEPDLQGKQVFFHLRSHGYEYPKDGFGYRGFRCLVKPGSSKTVKLPRTNVAERLYRVTGAGLYRDSVLVDAKVPLEKPLLNGGVFGQDSVVNAIYGGKLYWFWGDTNRASYPLGNFAVSGATSLLPKDGGLPQAQGVDLTYFVGKDGFSRPMCKIKGPGPVWIFGLMVVEHQGRERLLCHYARMKNLGTRYEHGIAIYNDTAQRFDKLRQFPLDAPLHPAGNPTRVEDEGGDWFYFPNPYPVVRVRARYAEILDPKRYEAFTCLRPGVRWNRQKPSLDHRDGQLNWGWKHDTAVVTPARFEQLTASKKNYWMGLRDVETGKRIRGHGGTVTWNAHRKKWVMIALETFGRSMLGEVWFAEADTLLGPWGYARRIVTHTKYSFYNVKQHPYFDEGGGRWIYFEGTYTTTFSGNEVKTPRYDYNQIMYRLDLDDPRLRLPVPVYEVAGADHLLAGREIEEQQLWSKVARVPFWAHSADDNTVPGYRPLPTAATAKGTVPLYEWSKGKDTRILRAKGDGQGAGWRRAESALGRVWPSPAKHPPLAR